MRTFIVFWLILFFSFNNAAAQDRGFSFLIGKWEGMEAKNFGGGFEVVDTGKIFLVLGKERKPMISFQADFSRSPAWFDFTIKDTAGTTRFQSLLQVINENMIQWQLFDSTRANYFMQGRGEIFYLQRKQ